jgi:general secretion pathway protein C
MPIPHGDVPVMAMDSNPIAPLDTVAVGHALGGGGTTAVSATEVTSVAVSSRFVLMGIVAASSQTGAALIAVDGKAAKPYRVGAHVAEEWVLRGVQPKRAILGRAAGEETQVVLDMPVRNNSR